MGILLEEEEIELVQSPTINMPPPTSRAVDIRKTRLAREQAVARAQLKKVADKIESMTDDGMWLCDIIKEMRKEISDD